MAQEAWRQCKNLALSASQVLQHWPLKQPLPFHLKRNTLWIVVFKCWIFGEDLREYGFPPLDTIVLELSVTVMEFLTAFVINCVTLR